MSAVTNGRLQPKQKGGQAPLALAANQECLSINTPHSMRMKGRDLTDRTDDMQLPKRDREPQHDHPARDAYCDVDRWRADGAKKKPAEAG